MRAGKLGRTCDTICMLSCMVCWQVWHSKVLVDFLTMNVWCSLQSITASQHRKLLQKNRHLRYMWFPYTDSVVVVTNNPVKEV